MNERDRAMAELLSTIKPEQMNKLIGAFDEQQMQTFLAVYTSYRDHPPSDASAAAPGTPAN